MMEEDKNCSNCRFADYNEDGQPCKACIQSHKRDLGRLGWEEREAPMPVKTCSTCQHKDNPETYPLCTACLTTYLQSGSRYYVHWKQEKSPEKRPGHPMFYELLEKLSEIHSRKNQDYGNGNPLGNFMGVVPLGVDPFVGVLVRMSDKWSRICTLSQKDGQGQVKDESIEDTLLDMAAYALLAIVIRREGKKTS